LGDSEYACAPFINQTADIDCDKLLRLRPNQVLYYPPLEEYSGVGRPPLHGKKFSLKDSTTWGDWQEELYVVDPKQGNLRVRMWQDLHLTGQASVAIEREVHPAKATAVLNSQCCLDFGEGGSFFGANFICPRTKKSTTSGVSDSFTNSID
jgi:hypothetical protein